MKQSGSLVASATLLIGVLLMAHSSPAATPPGERLDDFFREATTVLSEASHASQAEHEISQLARRLFDVPGVAHRVLEPEWSALSVVEREEFTRLFGDRLLRGFLSIVRGKLPRDRPPTIRLVGEEVGASGRTALVRTTIRAKDGADVRFDYVMTKAGASWLVDDVAVDGVSLIENYRAQVAHVLRVSSYAGLVARLRSGTAAGGQQGLEKAVALRPDIVITDVAMPVMDGRETIRRLREDDRTRHIPIIVCSAHAGGENLLADAVLEKPFSLHHLLSEVRRLVGGGGAA